MFVTILTRIIGISYVNKWIFAYKSYEHSYEILIENEYYLFILIFLSIYINTSIYCQLIFLFLNEIP